MRQSRRVGYRLRSKGRDDLPPPAPSRARRRRASLARGRPSRPGRGDGRSRLTASPARLADARAKRDEAFTILCDGRDPGVAKKLKIEVNLEASRQTFERIAREWHGSAKAQWATIHANDIIRSLERDVFPTIGALPISQLRPPLILGILREIETRGVIETAKRVRQRISAVFVMPSRKASRLRILPKSWARFSSRCARDGSRRSPRSCHCAR